MVKGQAADVRFKDKWVQTETGCWSWTGAVNHNGYGVFWDQGRMWQAHRWSYERHKSKIPSGSQIDHLCRVRSCVNPDHLEPVTAAENTRRSPAYNGHKTHCPSGHEYTSENTYRDKTGRRHCKKCRYDRSRAARLADPERHRDAVRRYRERMGQLYED